MAIQNRAYQRQWAQAHAPERNAYRARYGRTPKGKLIGLRTTTRYWLAILTDPQRREQQIEHLTRRLADIERGIAALDAEGE